MEEFLKALAELDLSALVAVVAAVLIIGRGAAELFKALGKLLKNPSLGSVGNKIGEVVEWIGKAIGKIGIGSKDKLLKKE